MTKALTTYRDTEEDNVRCVLIKQVLKNPHLVMNKTTCLNWVVEGTLDDEDRLKLTQIGASSVMNVYSNQTLVSMPRSRKTDLVWVMDGWIVLSCGLFFYFLLYSLYLYKK